MGSEIHHILQLLEIQSQKSGKKENEIYVDIMKLNKKIQNNQARRTDITEALIPKLKQELKYFT